MQQRSDPLSPDAAEAVQLAAVLPDRRHICLHTASSVQGLRQLTAQADAEFGKGIVHMGFHGVCIQSAMWVHAVLFSDAVSNQDAGPWLIRP